MKKLLYVLVGLLSIGAVAALAQSFTMPPPAGVFVNGCVYNTTPITLTNGQTSFAQCDSKGNFIIDTSGGGASTVNQGNAGTNAQSWWMQIGNAITGPVNVVPASQAAPSTGISLEMQLNPLSPGIIPLGQSNKAGSVPVAFATDQYIDPCMNPLIAKSSTQIAITSATTIALVPVSGSTAVYVCHYNFTISEVITTANTLQFEYGTGTLCTGTNKLTGTYGAGGVVVAAPIYISAGWGGTIFTAPAANALCALTAIGATGSFQGELTYVQQ